jgi:hypothetical protein
MLWEDTHNAGADVCRWGSNLPNDVAASLDPVVQEGQACVGKEIGEAHICSCVYCEYGRENGSGVVEKGEESGTVFLVAGDCSAEKYARAMALARAWQCSFTTTPLHKSLCIWSTIVCRASLARNYSRTISRSQLSIVELLVLWVSSAINVESRRSIAELRQRLCFTPSTTNIMIPSPSSKLTCTRILTSTPTC